MTRRTDEQVFQMSVMDFFAWVAYAKYKAQKQEQKIREFRLKHNV